VLPPSSDDLARLPAAGVLVGLDLGTRNIGLAVTDATRRLARPVTTLTRTKFTADAAAILRLAAAHGAVGVVIGLPLNMDGSEGPRAQSARAFARHFQPLTPLPVVLFDERLSSYAAADRLRAAGASRLQREARIDAMAAAVILEGAIDVARRPPPSPAEPSEAGGGA
jgi:putative Holliday junction resolvase